MVIIDEDDLGKSREELLMDLVAEYLGFRIPLDKIVFGEPEALDQRPDLEFDPNTFIPAQIDIAYDSRFSDMGSGFMYRRRSIVEHASGCDFSKVAPTKLPFTTHDLIEQFNQCLPYPIDESDVVLVEYKTKEDYEKGVTFAAAPHSLFWTDGETIQIDDRWITGEPVIVVTDLPGFFKWKPESAEVLFARRANERIAAARMRIEQRTIAFNEARGIR